MRVKSLNRRMACNGKPHLGDKPLDRFLLDCIRIELDLDLSFRIGRLTCQDAFLHAEQRIQSDRARDATEPLDLIDHSFGHSCPFDLKGQRACTGDCEKLKESSAKHAYTLPGLIALKGELRTLSPGRSDARLIFPRRQNAGFVREARIGVFTEFELLF
jgi:hypothetical protein